MRYGQEMMRHLRDVVDGQGRTVLVVLHDINYAAAYADQHGRIVADGSPDEVLTVDRLEALFGYRMQVHALGSRLVVQHHD